MRHLNLSVLLLATASAAQAEPTIAQLEATARAIQSQLELSNVLSLGATDHAMTGGLLEPNALQSAEITQQMMDDYNAAIDAVINSQYQSAQDIFLEAHVASIGDLNTSINDLVNATTVLHSVVFVADMAASTNTLQEQTALQTMLVSDPSLQITQIEVDSFNQSLEAVGTYARDAGAFLAAANNSDLTAAVDNFAQTNNFAVGSYTAITLHQTLDEYFITWDNDGFAAGWAGYNTGNVVTADDLYATGTSLANWNM